MCATPEGGTVDVVRARSNGGRTREEGAMVETLIELSPFSLVRSPTTSELETEGPVHYVVVPGRQDDGLWGPLGAVWLSEDGQRGGFLVHPWALWEGSEFVRGYRSALRRGWTPSRIYGYWRREVRPRGSSMREERRSGSLAQLNDLVAAM